MNAALLLMRLSLVVLLLFAVVWLVAHRELLDPGVLQARLEDIGIRASLFFIFVYTMAVVACLPAALMTVAGGAIFGPLLGTTYNIAGAFLGAGLAFLISRYVASGWVRRRLGARLTVILDSVEAKGWHFVAFARLVPVFPFGLVSYALGMTHIRFPTYLAATVLFVSPGMFAFTYAGYAGRAVWDDEQDALIKLLFAAGLIAALILIPRFLRKRNAAR